MNWMNAACLLAGVGVGVEITYLCMKSKSEILADEMRSMENKVSELLKTNTRIIDRWGEAIELNNRLLNVLENRD